MGVRSDIGVQNVQKMLFGADKERSHKTSWSHNRGSFVAETTVPLVIDQTISKIEFCGDTK